MPREEYKPKDKVVMRMTREGAVEENLTEGTSEKISKRLEDAQLVKPHEDAAAALPEEEIKRRQPRPEELFPEQEAENVPTEQAHSEYKPGELPVHEATSPVSSASDVHRPAQVDVGRVVTDTAVSSSMRKTQAVRNVDGEAVMSKAAETVADQPIADDAIPATKKIQRLEQRSERAHERLDAAREKLPTKKVLKKERVFDEESGKGKTRLYFEDEIKMPKVKSKLQFEADKSVRKVGDTLASGIHGKIHEVEQDNSAVEAAHRSEIVAESAVRHYSHHRQNKANKPFEKVSKLEHDAQVADTKLHYEKTQQEHPEMKKQRTNMNKHYQKQAIKKEYAAARKAGSQTAGTATKNTGKKTREKAADKIKEFVAKNKKVFLWIGVGVLVLVLLAAGISSCTAMFSSTGSAIITSSYLSEDEAMLGAEAQYCQMEAELQDKLDNFESYYPGYDEYNYDLDDIEHDPYVLISILSALHDAEFTLSEVQSTLQMLFDKQYILTTEEIVEVRYRTETRVGSYTTTDPETGATSTHYYTYEVEVPYNYYIMNVTLENFNLSHVPVYIMSQDQLSMYATYMSVVGNREDLFPDSPYVDKYIENPPDEYTVNPSYMSDETFATLIEEAEKYLNYPYVWGGSNPETSFDCSGFVSYVLTNSGLVNTGRLGAQGLYNVCTPVSRADAKPGDLVFFVGTYDTPGVSHVGIYVGDGVMLHCGDPIQYSSINTSYWQSHFYAFGRPNY
ncbi:putative uncharacterized protein [Candidatus Colimorpha enterica]|uniref:NlpC/P60 domain-containing protein n=1 Tax=Candidatus Colimorpha enterica TaxID=3083063 RepID=R6U3D4_9BACT|nr:putative uncharacterized protein [Candidatus Colimorpha enterica]